ncbi:MAG TPA: M1 family aminopeptidase [Candidatus Polarisedimenticolaceae bacterium]
MARIVVALFLSSTLAAAAETPVLNAARAVVLENVAWKVGDATLRIEKGWAAPFASKDGKPLEVAFAGRATLECLPRERVEANYLAVFTGSPALSLEVDAAVLALGDPGAAERLLSGPVAADSPTAPAAAESFARAWLDSPERRGLELELLRWRSAFDDPVVNRFQALAVRTPRFGTVYAAVDPESEEPFQLGRFVPLPLGDHELEIARRQIGRERWDGRYLDLDVRDLGDWDRWVRYAPRLPGGGVDSGGDGYDIEDYVIDARVMPGGETLRGKARMRLRWLHDGLKTVRFRLFPDLKVESVRAGDGRELPFRQVRGSFAVALAEPSRTDLPATVEVEYVGAALEKDAAGYWWLRSTGGWYPQGGSTRATFDVTLRRPKRLDLFAAGRRVDGGENDGEAWERRVLDVPGLAFSFEVGKFDVLTDRAGDVELTFAFGRSPRPVPNPLQQTVATHVKQALYVYETLFGAYPYPTLTFVTVPRYFSQGYPGFISFAHPLLVGDPRYSISTDRGEAVETLAHELAHQWWGNKLGWRGYRDQWLSEALATYASTWFTYALFRGDETYLRDRCGKWHAELNAMSDAGRPIGMVGPMVLGERLDSSLAHAYAPIVYGKGVLVFNTLVHEIGEDAFLRILRSLADEVRHGTIDSSSFFQAIERASGRDLGPFIRTFVEGTLRPHLDIEKVAVAADGGRWKIRGEVEVTASRQPRVVARLDASARWSVAPARPPAEEPLEITRLVVPWVARTGEGEPAKRLEGAVALPVPSGAFEIVVEHEPKEFRINAMGLVYADRRDESTAAGKDELLRRGTRRALEGRDEEAEADFRAVLAHPPEPGRGAALQARYADGGAHVGLARVALDRGRDEEARAELELATEVLGAGHRHAFDAERNLLRARLELRSEEAEAAYARLAKRLYLPFRQRATETTSERARRVRFASGEAGTAESYAVLALAARLTNRQEVADLAAQEAVKRGADLSAFPW